MNDIVDQVNEICSRVNNLHNKKYLTDDESEEMYKLRKTLEELEPKLKRFMLRCEKVKRKMYLVR